MVHPSTLWYTLVHLSTLAILWYILVHSAILSTPYYTLVYFGAAVDITHAKLPISVNQTQRRILKDFKDLIVGVNDTLFLIRSILDTQFFLEVEPLVRSILGITLSNQFAIPYLFFEVDMFIRSIHYFFLSDDITIPIF